MPGTPVYLPKGYVQIGDFELGVGTVNRCVVVIKPKSDSKVDKKEADGKKGAVTTWKGAKPSQWDLELTWNVRDGIVEDEENDTRIEDILAELSPVGPNPGKPRQFASRRARIHATENVIVENIDGPDDKPGTSEVTAKLKLSSWTKPEATAAGQGDAKTDTDPQKWTAKGGQGGPTGDQTNNANNGGLPAGFGREKDSPNVKP